MASESDREQRIVTRWRVRGQTQALRPALGSAYPAEDAPGFDEALKAIDDAERQVWGGRGRADKPTG